MTGAKTATLQKIMKLRMKDQQEHDGLVQKRMRQRSSMRTQNLEPKPPDYVQRNSSKHRWYKEEEPGRVQQSFKQPATNILSQPYPISCTLKSSNHSSYIQTVSKPQLFVFSGEGDYLEWERTMDKWLSYNRITKKDALAYAISQLKGKAYKWLLQEEDDRRYYKEPSIKTWESLKLVLRSKYGSKGHTSLQSPKKKVTSAASFTRKKSETKMADCEKESSSFDKEMLNLIKNYMKLNKKRKLVEKEEVSDCLPWLRDHGETNLLRNNECFLNSSHSDLLFKNTQASDELNFLEPVQPSSIVSVSQVAKEDTAEHSTQGEELEQEESLQSNAISNSLSYELQEHCKESNMAIYVSEMFVKVSTEDVKRFGLEKVKDFCVSNSVFDNMLKSFKELETENLFDQKRFPKENNNISSHILSLNQFLKHRNSLDHHEKVLALDLKQSDFRFGKPCDSFSRFAEKGLAVNSSRHDLFTDVSLASTCVLNVLRKLQELKLHKSDIKIQLVHSANVFDFELNCLCAESNPEHVGLFSDDILVHNTFFDNPTAQLKLEFTDFECLNLIFDDIWVCNIFFDMHNRWRDHTVLCFGDILVYNTFFDMITHLTCQKQAGKGTGEKRGNCDQSMNDEMELQQRNLESCLAASFDIGAVRGSYLINQKDLGHKTNCIRNLTHQAITSSWSNVKSFSGERVMGSTTQVILSVPCLNFAEFRTSQTYLWRPGEYAKASDYVFKSSFIGYTDMMHLFLSKEPCADYEEAWKHTRRNSKCEEDKRFKPPDLDQDKHQDVTGFILIKEAPPDATFKPKPSRKGFGLMLLLYDKFLSANLFCVNEYESGLSNASGERRIKCISPFYITKRISNNAYHKGLQGKYKMISNFEVTNLVPCLADDPDLRTNLFEEGGDDMIMESSREWMQEPDYGELVAEDATRRIHWSRMEALSFLYFDLHSSYSTIKLIII